MPSIDKDIRLSAEFLGFLRSSFYAQIIFESAVTRLQSTLLPSNYVDTAHKVFDKLDLWLKEIEENLPLFSLSWNTPDSFDAINAMGFVKDVKTDLLWLIPKVEEALNDPNLPNNPEGTKLLAAAVLRSAATRHSYVETMHDIFFRLKAEDLAQEAFTQIFDAKGYLQNGQALVDLFTNNPPLTPELCDALRIEAALVPGDFRTQIHDAQILLNVYTKEFTYDLAGIPREEAQDWSDNRVPPVAAGYWHAYRFSPEYYFRWSAVGVRGAALAAYWQRAGFEPEDAIGWIQQGLLPTIAAQWARAGFPPERAVSLLQRGITDPTKAPRGQSDSD